MKKSFGDNELVYNRINNLMKYRLQKNSFKSLHI